MKLLILGGTGRTGMLVLRKALTRGFEVHALVRDKSKVDIDNPRLHMFEGTPTDLSALEAAMAGCKAVVSCLNISRISDWPWAQLRTPKDFLARTMHNVIEVAKKQGLKRIVVMSAAGVGDSKALLPGWFGWLIRNSNIQYAYAGHEEQEKLLAQSGLDWTVVRPVGLTNSAKDKELIVSINGQPTPRMNISRRQTARFLLDEIERGEYIGAYPVISEK